MCYYMLLFGLSQEHLSKILHKFSSHLLTQCVYCLLEEKCDKNANTIESSAELLTHTHTLKLTYHPNVR